MKNIILIALNGFKEVVRHKFFYGMALAALGVAGMGVVLGPLSMDEQTRITIDFSLFGIQIVLIAVCVFFGSLSITRDIEKKVLITLASKPLSRFQYILGKFLGIALIALITLFIMGCLAAVLFQYFNAPVNFILLKALWGMYMEALVLLSFSILFSTFASPFLIVCFSFGLFIIGHWINTVRLLLEKNDDTFSMIFSDYILYAFPNLERFNWRPYVVYQDIVPTSEVVFYGFYAFSWMALALTFAILAFNKKDFV